LGIFAPTGADDLNAWFHDINLSNHAGMNRHGCCIEKDVFFP
jgi:hypothetical protein